MNDKNFLSKLLNKVVKTRLLKEGFTLPVFHTNKAGNSVKK